MRARRGFPLLALSGPGDVVEECLLVGVKRTSQTGAAMSACDPERFQTVAVFENGESARQSMTHLGSGGCIAAIEI
jgi:hypothetical protein